MIAVLILAACVVIGVLFGFFATATSPVGYEDESGFHFGPNQKKSAKKESGYRVPQPKAA
jgi:hypothetical protein